MKQYIGPFLLLLFALVGCTSQQTTVYIPTYYSAQPVDGTEQRKAALPDGSVYEGGMKDGLFHGHGILAWGNGQRYEGEFKNGLFNGQGMLETPSGDHYQGAFGNGVLSGYGVLKISNGDQYEGEFSNDLFQGQGVYVTKSGNSFQGDFVAGDFKGQGEIVYVEGGTYSGEVENWNSQGKGVFVADNGTRYEGEFQSGQPEGHMKITYPSGDVYEGGVAGWDIYHGKGDYLTANGDRYDGRFEFGEGVGDFQVVLSSGDNYQGPLQEWRFHGEGVLTPASGGEYKGGFEFGLYHGFGILKHPDYGRYEGEFSYGSFDGEGELQYKNKQGTKVVVKGLWENGKYVGDDADNYVEDGVAWINGESVLYQQPDYIRRALDQLAPQHSGETDLYFVAFGSHGSQDVFMKEVTHANDVMNDVYATGERTVQLINNPQTYKQYPLATVTNLKATLEGVAEKMNLQEDVLFLYLSSHGSETHELSVELQDLPLQQLKASQLKSILDTSGIKWKVVVVSACYSGGFIDVLKDEHSLIITSASQDKTSFGCSNDAELTYFGEAFFKEALIKNSDFAQAFDIALQVVTDREKAEGFEPSEPQLYAGKLIEQKLAQLQTGGQLCESGAVASEQSELGMAKQCGN